MDGVMEEYISNLDLGPVKEYGKMAVIPLFSHEIGPDYLTLKEAMEEDLLIMTEVDESAVVGELKVKNLADVPVLLLDGEEIMGAKQNRVLNSSILIASGSEILIPVSCTEQGRWSYRSKKFKDSDVIAAHRIRRTKSDTVRNNLKNEGKFRSNQYAVWNEINEIFCDSGVSSKTHAMKDIYKARRKNLHQYKEAFPCHENQKGLIVLINNEIAGFEIISSEKAYKLLHDKLIKSYALDAITQEADKKLNKNKLKEAKLFLEISKKSKETLHKSVGYGCDHRFEGDSLIGSSLIYQDQMIHSAFFKLDAEDELI